MLEDTFCFAIVREHIPLEQGLRRGRILVEDFAKPVREHIPLEQGLRLRVREILEVSRSGQRAYSIRTRIKTEQPGGLIFFETAVVREHIPLEQGLRHSTLPSFNSWDATVREHIPLEQGLRRCPYNLSRKGETSESIFH